MSGTFILVLAIARNGWAFPAQCQACPSSVLNLGHLTECFLTYPTATVSWVQQALVGVVELI